VSGVEYDPHAVLVALRPYARHRPDCAWLTCILRAVREPTEMDAMLSRGCPSCSCGFDDVLRALPKDIRLAPYDKSPGMGGRAVALLLAEASFLPEEAEEVARRLLHLKEESRGTDNLG
jgi:hypothetical protein